MHARPRRHADPAIGRWVKLGALWSVIVSAVGGFGAAAVVTMTRPPDAYALCQASVLQAAASTVIIVDSTDTLTDIQRRRIKATIEAERDRMPRGGRLTIVSLNPAAPWEPIELASVCNPGTAAEANPLFATRTKIEKRWLEGFAEPIEAAIKQAVDGPASTNSPIIVTVAATLARPDFDARVAGRRLVIISDLLEHEKGGYSQLKGGNLWSAWRASPLSHTARLDLRGVAVSLDYLMRGQYAAVQGPKHREFWQRLFTEAGAAEVAFIGLQPPAATPAITKDERLVKRIGRN